MIRRRSSKRKEVADLDVTAFMNLMVVLVPFLLITAVFSRITILELNLPAESASTKPPKQSLQLKLTVLPSVIRVSDRSGLIRSFRAKKDGVFDMSSLSKLMMKIKSRSDKTKDVRILFGKNIKYDILVQVMDAVRSGVIITDGQTQQIELFPSISIGEAG